MSGLQAECSRRASKEEREGPRGVKDGSEFKDEDMREVCKGGRCVVAKRRLCPLKPNRPGLTSWLYCLLAIRPGESYLSSQSLGYLPCAMGY